MRQTIACSPQLPCNDARHCDYCARRRQAHVAELAATRYRGGLMTYAVIDPRGFQGINETRLLKPGTGGLWSVETGGKVKGLHVNLLIEGQQSFSATDIATIDGRAGVDFWAKQIDPTELRNLAAYIVKREGRPSTADYAGRQYGTWGTWNSARQIAQAMTRSPVVRAAAHQIEINALGLGSLPTPTTPPDRPFARNRDPITRAEAREIAARHLPELWAILSTDDPA
jgi:hypothetical protein